MKTTCEFTGRERQLIEMALGLVQGFLDIGKTGFLSTLSKEDAQACIVSVMRKIGRAEALVQ